MRCAAVLSACHESVRGAAWLATCGETDRPVAGCATPTGVVRLVLFPWPECATNLSPLRQLAADVLWLQEAVPGAAGLSRLRSVRIDLATLNKAPREWERIYKTVRPRQSLGYLTPRQFLQRTSPPKRVLCHDEYYELTRCPYALYSAGHTSHDS